MLSNITQRMPNCTPESSENSWEKTFPGGKPLQGHCPLHLATAGNSTPVGGSGSSQANTMRGYFTVFPGFLNLFTKSILLIC